MYTCEMHVHEMHDCEVYAYEKHVCKIYAHRSVAFSGGDGGAGVVNRTAVFTLASDDDIDSLHQTMSISNPHHG